MSKAEWINLSAAVICTLFLANDVCTGKVVPGIIQAICVLVNMFAFWANRGIRQRREELSRMNEFIASGRHRPRPEDLKSDDPTENS